MADGFLHEDAGATLVCDDCGRDVRSNERHTCLGVALAAAPFAVTFHPARFTYCGDVDDVTPATARFLTSIEIGGVAYHLDGYEVHRRPDTGEQEAKYFAWEQEVAHLFNLAQPDGPFATLRIEDREYVVVCYPHSA